MNHKIYVDFDGVIVDSVEEIKKMKKKFPDLTWEEFSKKINWEDFYKKTSIINDGINYIKNSKEEIVIITKTNCIDEQIAKVKYLRNFGIKNMIIVIPPKVWKTDFIIPNSNDVLIDDNYENIFDWNKKGGIGILFDTENTHENCISINNLNEIRGVIK